jgi:polysaccharide deacetylase 2 family uncharacterized protein YibQ
LPKRRIALPLVLFITIAVLLSLLLILLPGNKQERGTASSAHTATEDTGPRYSPERQSITRKPESRPSASEPFSPRDTTPEHTSSEKEREPESAAMARPIPEEAVIYVIIDDVGYNLDQVIPFLQVPIPMTFSVLPDLIHSREAARKIVEAGQEVMLHLPMEAEKGNDPGPGAIYTDMQEVEIRELVKEHLASLPMVVGVNNHMGSEITTHPGIMQTVLSVLAENDLFFIDSLTTSESVVETVAKNLDFAYLCRDVFLDNNKDRKAVEKAFMDGVRIAKQKGEAVLIGHIQTTSLPEVLQQGASHVEELGVEFKPISHLARTHQLEREKSDVCGGD